MTGSTAPLDPTGATERGQHGYNVAGILVRTRPSHLADVATILSRLPGVEVHHQEAATGRLVVTLETTTIEAQETGLTSIQGLVGVVGAALVYHCFAPPDPAGERPDAACAPGDLS
jgi:nitrate reductase NapD